MPIIKVVHVVLVFLFGRPIVQSISHFLVGQNKIVFLSSFLKNPSGTFIWFCSVSWPTNCPVNFSFFGLAKRKLSCLRDPRIFLSTGQKIQESQTKHNEKLTVQLVGQETDKNHMDVPFIFVWSKKLATLFWPTNFSNFFQPIVLATRRPILSY